MNKFTQAYIECFLWLIDDDSGVPLNNNYGVKDIDPATLLDIVEDCRRFQEENANDIATYLGDNPEEIAGHDFYLIRNGHGEGFFSSNWPEEVGERLMAACEAYGEVYFYVEGDKIYN